jgi:hypothetical protein
MFGSSKNKPIKNITNKTIAIKKANNIMGCSTSNNKNKGIASM